MSNFFLCHYVFKKTSAAKASESVYMRERGTERPPRVLEIAGSNAGRIIQNTLKLLVMAALLGAQGCRVSITTDWLVSG